MIFYRGLPKYQNPGVPNVSELFPRDCSKFKGLARVSSERASLGADEGEWKWTGNVPVWDSAGASRVFVSVSGSGSGGGKMRCVLQR